MLKALQERAREVKRVGNEQGQLFWIRKKGGDDDVRKFANNVPIHRLIFVGQIYINDNVTLRSRPVSLQSLKKRYYIMACVKRA